jgi:hypothetical protein
MELTSSTKKAVTKLLREANQLVLSEYSCHSVSPTARHVTDTFISLNELLIAVSSDSMQLTQTKLFETLKTQL